MRSIDKVIAKIITSVSEPESLSNFDRVSELAFDALIEANVINKKIDPDFEEKMIERSHPATIGFYIFNQYVMNEAMSDDEARVMFDKVLEKRGFDKFYVAIQKMSGYPTPFQRIYQFQELAFIAVDANRGEKAAKLSQKFGLGRLGEDAEKSMIDSLRTLRAKEHDVANILRYALKHRPDWDDLDVALGFYMASKGVDGYAAIMGRWIGHSDDDDARLARIMQGKKNVKK